MTGWKNLSWRALLLAVLATGVALGITLAIPALFQRSIMLLFITAVMVSAWFGGLLPGLLTALLSLLAIDYFLIGPSSDMWGIGRPEDAIPLVFFALAALLVSSLAAARRQAEDQERKQREQLRVTLTSIGDAVIATDPAGKITFLNPVAESLTGWKLPEALGVPLEKVFVVVNEETRRPVENPVVRIIREGRIVGLANHTLLLSQDGREIAIDDSGAPIRDAGGALAGCVMVFRDISAKRRTEDELQQSRDQLAIILRGVVDGVTALDGDGRLVYANEGAARILGFASTDELTSAPAQDIWSRFEVLDEKGEPLFLDRLPSRVALSGQTPEGMTVRFRDRQTGEDRYSTVTATPILGDGGKVRMVVNFFQDITPRTRAEQRISVQYAVSRILAESQDLDQAARRILEAMGTIIGFQVGAIWQPEAKSGLLHCTNRWGLDGKESADFERATRTLLLAPGEILPGRVWVEKKPLWIPDIVLDPEFARAQVAKIAGLHAGFAFPILLGSQPLGVIEFFNTHARPSDPELLELMPSIGQQIGQFSERKRNERALRRALAEADLLKSITTASSGEQDLERILTATLDRLSRVLPFTGGSIALVEGEELVVRAAVGPGATQSLGHRLPSGQDLSSGALDTGAPTPSDETPVAGGVSPRVSRSRIAAPLIWRGERIGVLHVDSTEPDAFRPGDLELLQKVALGVSGSIEVARQYAVQTQTLSALVVAQNRTGFLAEAGRVLAGSLDYGQTLQHLAELVVPFLADWCEVDLIEEDQSLNPIALSHSDPSKRELARQLREQYPPDADHPILRVLATREPVLEEDIPDAEWAARAQDEPHLRLLRQLGIRGRLTIPMVARGRSLGAISFVLGGPRHAFDPAAITLAQDLTHRAAAAVDNARLYHDAQRLNEELEQRVIRRTAQLSAANQQLERQVTERKQAELRFRTLLESAPDSVIIANEQGVMVLVNSQTEEMFGYARAELLGQPLEMLMPARFRSQHVNHRSEFLRSPRQRAMGSGLQLLAQHKDGREFPIEVSLSPLRTEEGLLITAAVRDITERQRAEEKVRESEQQLAKAQQVAHLGSWQWDPATGQTTWSDELFRIHGLEPQDRPMTFERWMEHLHPDDRERFRRALKSAADRRATFALEHRIVLPNGQARVIHSLGEAVLDARGSLIRLVGTGHDITERKRAEEQVRQSREQLRRLSGHLQSAREEERTRVAREVHDQLGQVLSALKIDMTLLGRKFADGQALPPAAVVEEIQSMLKLMDETIHSVRKIIMELRPELLEDLGLRAAIEWQTQEFQTRTGIHTELECNVEQIHIDTDRAMAVFRVVQESLTNVLRHAEASNVKVILIEEGNRLSLTVQDDGRGLRESDLAQSNHFGILGIQERALLLGGQAEIQGMPGEGTRVDLSIPLQSEEPQDVLDV